MIANVDKTELKLFFVDSFPENMLKDFKSIYSYATIENQGYDIRYIIYPASSDVVANSNPIQYYPSSNPKEVKVNFFDDFLPVYFENSLKKYKQEYLYEIIKQPLSRDATYTFLDSKIDEIQIWIEKTKSLYNLKGLKEFQKATTKELQNLRIEFESHLPKSLENFNHDKIKLKMGKNEIYFLFKYLNNKGFIESSEFTNDRVSELLEKHFLFYDKKLKSYQEIRGMKKYIQNLERDKFRKNNEDNFNDFELPS